MKAIIKKYTDILDTNSCEAFLLKTTQEEGYNYEISYNIDANKALIHNVNIVEILISKNSLSENNSQNIFEGNSIEQITQELLYKISKEKDLSRTIESSVFLRIKSDITKKIPNDQIKSLKNNTSTTKTTSLNLFSSNDLKNKNITYPIFETNIFSKPEYAADIKKISNNLINEAIDPAQIFGTPTNNIISARKSIAGLGLSGKKTSLYDFILLSNNPSTNVNVNNNSLINVKTEQQFKNLTLKEIFTIPFNTITDSFYVTYKVKNKNGIELQRKSLLVPHSKLIEQENLISQPPIVNVVKATQAGKNVLYIKQKDPMATGISVYKKNLNLTLKEFEKNYNFIGDLELSYGEDFKSFIDLTANSSDSIYRCIPYNNEKKLSCEFTSVGVKTNSKILKNKNLFKNDNTTIVTTLQLDNIKIEITDIPVDAINIELHRRNLTIKQKESDLINTFFISSEGSNKLTFKDTTVSQNHSYEYFIKILYKTGTKNKAKTSSFITFVKTKNNIVETIIESPNVIFDTNGIDVKFNIASTFLVSTQDKIRQFLQEQGILDFYLDEISQEKDKFQNLIAYDVSRTNITNGEVENFGIINSVIFSDIEEGRIKNVSPLKNGMEYKYSVTTYFRITETMLKYFTKQVTDKNNRTYTLYPYKWRHPVTLKEGNIVSDNSLKRNHSENQFTFGEIANFVETQISLSGVIPSIKEASAIKLSDKKVLVKWTIQGNSNKFDHFLIILEILGMRKIIGKSHNVTNSNFFQFVDNLTDNEKGKFKYYVVPIYYDFSKGTEIETNEVKVQ